MDQILKGLASLLLKFQVVEPSVNQFAPVVFAIGCAIIGVLTVIADWSFYTVRGQSLLFLKHGYKNTAILLLAWAFGSAFIGYIGQMLDIFRVSLLSCATVGVSWPIILTKLLDRFRVRGTDEDEVVATVEE